MSFFSELREKSVAKSSTEHTFLQKGMYVYFKSALLHNFGKMNDNTQTFNIHRMDPL